MQEKQFVLKNPRQSRLHRLLEKLVGPGTSILYYDSCKLLEDGSSLETQCQLIFHLYRDIESALRDVILTIEQKKKIEGNSKEGQHKQKVIEALSNLNIQPESNIAKKWLGLIKDFPLSRYAHRNGLYFPRKLSKDILNILSDYEALFEEILTEIQNNFINKIILLDKLLEKDTPTKKDVNQLVSHCPNTYVHRGYFFDKLNNSFWLQPLNKKGIFSNPPNSRFDYETGDIKLLPWPESRYLARMSSHSQSSEKVKDIILSMEGTDNYYVHGDILDAALSMQTKYATELVDKIIKFIDRPSVSWNFERYGKFVVYLAKSSEIDNAIKIAKKLFKLLPDSRYKTGSKLYSFGPEPESLFDNFWYKEIIEQVAPVLVEHGELKTLKLFINLLKNGIQLTKNKSEKIRAYSYFFGPLANIENFEQERIHDDPIDMLLWAVRYTTERLIDKYEKKVLEFIENVYKENKKKYIVFIRIGMYLRRKCPGIDMTGTEAILTDKKNYGNIYLHTEIFHLLEKCFGNLNQEAKNIYFDYVNEMVKWDKYTPKEEKTKRNRRMIFDRLYPVREHLAGEWEKKFEELSKEFEAKEHPDLLVYFDSVGFSGFQTPKNQKEISSMPFDKMIEYFRTELKRTNLHEDNDILEGYARILEDSASQEPDKYSSHTEKFKGLPPACIDGMLRGLRNAIKSDNKFKESYWFPVFDLCKWVVEQDRDENLNWGYYGKYNPGWGWTRKAISALLEESLKKENIIPFKHKEIVWEIIEKLTDDPNPIDEDENDESFAPFTRAINTVRGSAMVNVFHYIKWVKNNCNITQGFDKLQKVRECLERHLEQKQEKKLSIRSVYGVYFHTLASTDEQWTIDHLNDIFPCYKDRLRYFNAAFESYIKFNNPHNKAFILLKDKYIFAIDHITDFEEEDGMGRTDERLIEHLMVLYWHGEISMDDPDTLLPVLYKKASGSLRAHAIDFIGKNLKEADERVKPRLKNLWEKRLSIAESGKLKDFEKELTSFGSWFIDVKFEIEWMLQQLKKVLELYKKVEMDRFVIKWLSTISDNHPLATVNCLSSIIEGDEKGWIIYHWKDDARKILSNSLKSADEKARKSAFDLVNRIVSLGYLEFRDLLQGH